MPLHMAVCKTDSNKKSFICKAKSAGVLQKQRHLLCTRLTNICSGTANIFMLLPDLQQLLLETALKDSSEHLRNLCTATQWTV